MAEYIIETEDVPSIIEDGYAYSKCVAVPWLYISDDVINRLKPLVYCKDCKHSYDDISGLHCSYGVCVDCVVDEDFYCKNGEEIEE